MGPLVHIDFLGESFNKWIFPSLLILMILLTAFDCFGRMLNCIGLKQYAFDEDYAEEKVIEGKAVIERYQRYHKRKALLETGGLSSGSRELLLVKETKANGPNQIDVSGANPMTMYSVNRMDKTYLL